MDTSRRLMGILSVAFILVFIVIWGLRHSCDADEKERDISSERFRFEVEKNPLVDHPEWFPVDEEQIRNLKVIYLDLARAYSNENVEVLCKWAGKLPTMVEHLPDKVFVNDLYRDIIYPFERVVGDEFIWLEKNVLRDFTNVEKFEHYADVNLLAVRLLGDGYMCRWSGDGVFRNLEAGVLKKFLRYKSKFRMAGRKDLEQAAERRVSEWIGHIESTNGYTRACVAHSVFYAKRFGWREMEMSQKTWNDVLEQAIGQMIDNLVSAGYTPKWLQEFKNIPEPKIWVVPREM